MLGFMKANFRDLLRANSMPEKDGFAFLPVPIGIISSKARTMPRARITAVEGILHEKENSRHLWQPEQLRRSLRSKRAKRFLFWITFGPETAPNVDITLHTPFCARILKPIGDARHTFNSLRANVQNRNLTDNFLNLCSNIVGGQKLQGFQFLNCLANRRNPRSDLCRICVHISLASAERGFLNMPLV